jgi:hypothetical protein
MTAPNLMRSFIDVVQIYRRVHTALDGDHLGQAISNLQRDLAIKFFNDTGTKIGPAAFPTPNYVKIVCRFCGSENVRGDAWAKWNTEDQEWKLTDADFVHYYCRNCDGPARIEEAPVYPHAEEPGQ